MRSSRSGAPSGSGIRAVQRVVRDRHGEWVGLRRRPSRPPRPPVHGVRLVPLHHGRALARRRASSGSRAAWPRLRRGCTWPTLHNHRIQRFVISTTAIVVVKDAQPNDPQDFSFTAGGGLSPAELPRSTTTPTARCRTRARSPTSRPAPATRSPRRVPERLGPDRAPPATTAARSSNIDVAAGEIVTCTFTNRKRGQIVVVKDAVPERPAGLRLHGRRRPLPGELPARRRRRRRRCRTRARSPTSCPAAATRSRETVPGRLGPDQRDLRRRQPGLEHRRRARARPSPARSRTASAGTHRGREGRHARTTRRTSPSRPAAASAPPSFPLDDDADGDALEHAARSPTSRPAAATRCRETRARPAGTRPSATCDDGSPVVEHRRRRRRDGHLHVHEPQARAASWSSRTRTPNDPQDFSLHGRRRPLARRASRSTTTPTATLVEHAHVQRRAARHRLLARRDRAGRLGPDRRHLQRRQPGRRTSTWPPARPSPAPSRTASAAQHRGRQGRAAQRPAGLLLHGRRRPQPDELPARRRRRRRRSSNTRTFADVVARHRLLARRDRAQRLGPDERDLRRRQPGRRTSTWRRRDRHLHLHEPQARAASWSSRTPRPTTRRTSPSRPAAACQPVELPARRRRDDGNAVEHAHVRRRVRRGRLLGRRDAVPAGWDQTRATCDDGSPVSNIDVAPGETVTCTFANRKRGQIVVVKDARPNDPQDFSFTAGGGLVPSQLPARRRRHRDECASQPAHLQRGPGSGYSVSGRRCRAAGPDLGDLLRRLPGLEHRRGGGRDGHLHVREHRRCVPAAQGRHAAEGGPRPCVQPVYLAEPHAWPAARVPVVQSARYVLDQPHASEPRTPTARLPTSWAR